MAEQQLRANLIKACEQGLDPSKIVPLCDRLLNVNKSDVFGLRCKAIALLKSKRIDQAATVAKELASVSGNKRAAAAGRFLLAMCLYRDNKFTECEQTLVESGKTDKFGAQEYNLLAQARFNQFRFKEAAEIYEKLLDEELYQDDVEREEVLTNLTACYAGLADVDKCKKFANVSGSDDASTHHDLLFNYATALAQTGRFREASAVLANAERVCIYSFEKKPEEVDFLKENIFADKKETSLFVRDVVAIKAQQAFVAFNLGDRSTAEKILHAILVTHNSILNGTATHATAALNWTALKRHSDFVDSYKKLKLIQQPAFAKRLTEQQREAAAYNAFLLSVGVGKQAQARSMAESLCRDFPNGTLGPRALAAILASSDPGRAESTMKKLLEDSSSSASSKIHQTLTMAQIALERGDVAGAIEIASSNNETMSQPAVITTILAGAASLNDTALIDKLLAQKNIAGLLSTKSDFALQVALNVLSRVGRHAEAAALLEKAASSKSVESNKQQKSLLLGAAIMEYVRGRDIQSANRIATSPDSPVASKTNFASASASAKYTLAQTESTALPREKLVKVGFSKLQTSSSPSSGNGAPAVVGGQVVTADKGPRKRPLRRVPKEVKEAKEAAAAKTASASATTSGNNNKTAAGGQSNHTTTNLPKMDPERWLPWNMRTYVKDMPPRRRLEAKRRRADEQEEKRKAAAKRKQQQEQQQLQSQ